MTSFLIRENAEDTKRPKLQFPILNLTRIEKLNFGYLRNAFDPITKPGSLSFGESSRNVEQIKKILNRHKVLPFENPFLLYIQQMIPSAHHFIKKTDKNFISAVITSLRK